MLIFLIVILLLGGGGAFFYAMRGSGDTLSIVSARLGRYGLASQGDGASQAVGHLRSGGGKAAVRAADRLADRAGLSVKIQGKLERADLKTTAGEYLTMCLAAFLIACLVGLVLRGILGLLGLGVIGLAAPWVYLWRRAKKRRRAFIEQLADMCQMMGNSMRAGFSIIQSMELVGHEASKPACDEFERVVTEIKLGLPVDQALDHLLQRIASEDLELMVVAINVQRQIGGNLSEILAVISNTIRERVRFERDLRALTAQARYSSYIITALPIGVGVVINLMDREYESYLYTATLGHIMIGIALTMVAVGFFFLNKIANIEV